MTVQSGVLRNRSEKNNGEKKGLVDQTYHVNDPWNATGWNFFANRCSFGGSTDGVVEAHAQEAPQNGLLNVIGGGHAGQRCREVIHHHLSRLCGAGCMWSRLCGEVWLTAVSDLVIRQGFCDSVKRSDSWPGWYHLPPKYDQSHQ